MKYVKLVGSVLSLACASQLAFAAPQPIKPVGNDGRVLNFDFEDGTLKDWDAVGSAFEKQPVRGDTVHPRRGDMKSNHHGEYWIGTYEVGQTDAPQGMLSSVPFKVTHPFASFLIAGGSHPETRVELVTADDKKVFFKMSGYDGENLRPAVVDLKAVQGRDIFIRLVDEHSGGWGHINFDNFVFYDQKPTLPNQLDPSKNEVPEADQVMYSGLSPQDAAAKMTLPPGFKATLFAGEPDVKQPIAFAMDDRGRLWVAEAYTYPIRVGVAPRDNRPADADHSVPTPEQLKDILGGHDRILVFEDTDGDGKFDKRTVFMEGLNLVSGLEVGFGGVFVGASPYMLYIPVQDGDAPKPAGNPQILLDGFAYQDTHETLNTFTWGPDGWLYGCHGVFTHSSIGKPGTPEDQRVHINAGVWRYHPTKKKFELFAEGTSNPWGIDFDEHGQCITEACVIPHLFHMIQGGRFTRQAGSHFNPFVYDDIKTIADHVHWAGNKGPHAGNGRSAAAGGGHAHAGLLVYQGDNWPEQYRGRIFMNNIHGSVINMDIPERKGSGFVGHHGQNLINFNDTWSQIINLETAPDGAVYMIDWYDKNQCHHNDPNGHDRSNGRIFRISYGEPKFEPVDLQKLSDEDLADAACSTNTWVAKHARRILAERFTGFEKALLASFSNSNTNNLDAQQSALRRYEKITGRLKKTFASSQDPITHLKAFWALNIFPSFEDNWTEKALSDSSEFVRAWAIQFLCAERNVSPETLKEFTRLAREDKSPVVRLYLASALQRLPVESRWDAVEALYSHAEDADDHNLPLMYWYAASPLTPKDVTRALKMAEGTKIPNLLNFTVRHTAAIDTPAAYAEITKSILRVASDSTSATNPRVLDILNALGTAFQGRRSVPMPEGWNEVEEKLGQSSNPEIRAQVQALSVTFGSQNASALLRKTLTDTNADANARRTALESLLAVKAPGLAPDLQQLLTDVNLRGAALRGLAMYDDSQTPAKIIANYNSFNPAEKRDALSTLAGRVAFAKPLLAAVELQTISRKDLSADLIRQLRTLKNDDLNKSIERVWGAMRETTADKKVAIEKYKKVYWAGGSQPGDASRGRLVFSKTCQQCHTLFDTGGKVGPDLTGSNRGDLSYILENIVDPNAVIPNDYRASTIEMKDDRVITGIIKKQDDTAVTVVTPNETMVLPRKEISAITQSQLSMMPEGLLDQMTEQEVRDLLYYLSRPGQVPMAQAAK